MKLNYLDKHGLGTFMSLVKKGVTGVYTVKGRAIYADAAFVALPPADKRGRATAVETRQEPGHERTEI